MTILSEVFKWSMKNSGLIWSLTLQHLTMTVVAVFISVILGVFLGILISRYQRLAFIVINLSNAFYTIPSLAIFGFLVPFLGVGIKPAIIALVLYGQFVLIGHTYTGVTGVDRAILEAGKAMGLTNRQILFSIQLPLGFPLIAAGIRTATTLTISIVVIGAWVGAGGLGVLMFRGIASSNWVIVLAGSIPVLVLSIVADILLSCAQPLFTPKGLRDR